MKLSGRFARIIFKTPLRLAPLGLLAVASYAHADWTLVRADASVTAIHAASLYEAQTGQRFSPDDIVESSGNGVVQIQDDSGNLVALGPDTRAMLTRDSHIALLHGWVKVMHVCASASTACALPVVETGRTRFTPADSTTLVIAATPDGYSNADAVFCESGAAHVVALDDPHGKAVEVSLDAHASAFALHAGTSHAIALARGPEPAFVAAMPLTFRDALRPLPLLTPARGLPAHGLRPVAYADVADWLGSALAVRNDPATRFTERFRARLSDPAFSRDVKQHIRALPDWRPLIFPPPRAAFKPFLPAYSPISARP
jgi:hypothetical protein